MTTTWNIDASHSEVGFKIRHLMISNVNGHFTNYTATVTTEYDNFETATIQFEAEAKTLTTGSEQRDAHLLAEDFFDAGAYPTIKFASSAFTKNSDGSYTVNGDLTIKGITKPMQLNAVNTGIAKDPWGQTKTAFEVEGKINRTEFGLVWNAPLETGGFLLSEEVTIHADVQFVKA